MATRGINKVILIGTVGTNPEKRHLKKGSIVVSFSLLTGETWKDRETKETKERKEWHKIVIYGNLGEIAHKYLRKGSQAYIEGSIQSRKWTDKENVVRKVTEIVLNTGINGVLQMLYTPKRRTTEEESTEENIENTKNEQFKPENQELIEDKETYNFQIKSLLKNIT